MNPYEIITHDLAERAVAKATRKAVRAMQRSSDRHLGGDDGLLANFWEEVCVQVQYQELLVWPLYIDLVEGHVASAVESLPALERQAIALDGPDGSSWALEVGEDARTVSESSTEIIAVVLASVLGEAVNWSNERIREYLERSSPD